MKIKFKKVYKYLNHLLFGIQVKEINCELSNERSVCKSTIQSLEDEKTQKGKLEKINKSLVVNIAINDVNRQYKSHSIYMSQDQNKDLHQNIERLNETHFNDHDKEASSAIVWKQKCDRLAKELENSKKNLAQLQQDDKEQIMAVKKQLEKKVKIKFKIKNVCNFLKFKYQIRAIDIEDVLILANLNID